MGQTNKEKIEIYDRRVLVMRFSALGDVAMAIPVVYNACHANPDTLFVFLTKQPVAALFQNKPCNLEVEGVDLKGDYKGKLAPLRIWKYLNGKYRFTCVADLHSVLRTWIIDICAVLTGKKVVRINKQKRAKRKLVRLGANKFSGNIVPVPALYRAVLNELGIKTAERQEPVMPVLPCSNPMIDETKAGKCVAVAPFAAHKGKIYPLEKMREVVGKIAGLPGAKVFLFGGGGKESEILSGWESEIPGVTNLAGKKLGFANELAVIGRCDAMISMDSANMHLAQLCGVPVVSIWGATHPVAGFTGENENVAVQSNLDCRPCSVFGNKPCRKGNYECFSAVSPDTILKELNKLMK